MVKHKENVPSAHFVLDDDPLRLWIGWRDSATGVAFMGRTCAFMDLPEDKRLRFPKERKWIGERIGLGEDPWTEGDPWTPERIEELEKRVLVAGLSDPKLKVLLTSDLMLIQQSFTQPLRAELDKLKNQGLSEKERQQGLVKHVREILEVLMPEHEERARDVLAGIIWPEGPEALFDEIFVGTRLKTTPTRAPTAPPKSS